MHAGPLDAPADDYDTSGFTTYPDEPVLRLLFPAVYHHDTDGVDGRVYNWVSREPIVTLGVTGAWDGGSLHPQPNLVRLPDGRLALPYDAYDTTHNEAWFKTFYGEYPGRTAVGWAVWEEARLAGIAAAQTGGFTTLARTFERARVEINAKTARAGGVEVELRERGRPVPGYTFADAVPFRGDEVWPACRWRGKDDLADLKGKGLELAFRLRHATAYAYRFA